MASLQNLWDVPSLRKDLLKFLGILTLARLATHIPLPCQPPDLLPLFRGEAFLALFDTFAGGAASRFSILALGAYPYLIARPLMAAALPDLHAKMLYYFEATKWERYVRLCTVAIAVLMGIGYLYLLTQLGLDLDIDVLSGVAIVITLAAGTMLFLWFGNWMAEDSSRGLKWLMVGNVLATMPQYLFDGVHLISVFIVRFLVAAGVASVYLILSEGRMEIPVDYGKRVRPSRVQSSRPTTSIPLRFNMTGLTSIFYLLSILGVMRVGSLLFQESSVKWIQFLVRVEQQLTDVSGLIFWFVFFLLGIPFKFAFKMAAFDRCGLAESLKRQGGFIPGVRPGKRTDQYLRQILFQFYWPEPILTMSLLTAPAFIYYGLRQPGIWPIMLVPAAYVTVPLKEILQTIEAGLLLRGYEGFVPS
jgi:preprotein translocase subunit SecY